MICNYIVTPIMTGAMILSVFIHEIKAWYLMVVAVVIVLIIIILYKILGLVKPDKLTNE